MFFYAGFFKSKNLSFCLLSQIFPGYILTSRLIRIVAQNQESILNADFTVVVDIQQLQQLCFHCIIVIETETVIAGRVLRIILEYQECVINGPDLRHPLQSAVQVQYPMQPVLQ